MKKHPHILSCVLLFLPLTLLGLNLQEDDLVFDDVGEDNANNNMLLGPALINHRTNYGRSELLSRRNVFRMVEKARSIPNVIVPVGHVFKIKVRPAFSGNVDFYEVHETIDHNRFPRWMYWDDAAFIILGVPSKKDVGNYHLTVTAVGKHGDIAKDQFVVQVVPEKQEDVKHKDGNTHCDDEEEQMILIILLDARLEQLLPTVRVTAIENLAGFLAMHTSAFSMHSQSVKDAMALDSTVIFTGLGNVKHHKYKETYLTTIQWKI